ncbi:polyphosphate polymerase domain-containing protein [Paludibacter sp. 221]|uniref:polyphosphate polymerase domain-containing protein n=1 Tax=Paludibacter sp. 221 TaxID=2302939 RepID=UPI0013D8DC95
MKETKDVFQVINPVLNAFDPISLEEMDKVKLMNRIDTKFLISQEQLPYLLKRALGQYRVVEIDGLRACPYSSIYFDTEDFYMYTVHHNGKLNRYKIRMRSYINSGISFLEVKRKSNKGRTSKKRIKIDVRNFQGVFLNEEEQIFIQEKSPFSYVDLRPSLQNFFNRITLVDKDETERVTIDVNLQFRPVGAESYNGVNGLVIIEMKQDGAAKSHFREYLNELSVLPIGMSKYCLGMILTNPAVKSNRFKKKIRYINKLTNSDLLAVR